MARVAMACEGPFSVATLAGTTDAVHDLTLVHIHTGMVLRILLKNILLYLVLSLELHIFLNFLILEISYSLCCNISWS